MKEQLREYIRWEDATRNLLSLLEAKGIGSHQPPQWEPLGIRQSTWDSKDGSNFKDMGPRLKGIMNILGKWEWGGMGGIRRCLGRVGRGGDV